MIKLNSIHFKLERGLSYLYSSNKKEQDTIDSVGLEAINNSIIEKVFNRYKNNKIIR